MKLKEGYLLKEVAGNHVIIPVGNISFDGMMKLNETGVLIWKCLEKGLTEDDILSAFLKEYDVEEERARQDIAAFIDRLKKAKILYD